MSVRPETKYKETEVLDAFMTESKEKGTAGLYFKLLTEDGEIEHTAWITPNTVERLKETLFECFSITGTELLDVAFLAKIGERIRGDKVSITTDEGDERYGVKVKWMNPAGFKPKKLESVSLKRIAGLFGGGPVSSPAYKPGSEPPPLAWGGGTGVTDDDVPF